MTAGASGASGASGAAWKMLAVVSLAQFLGMTLWFSATAVTPLLITEFDIAPAHAAWLTMACKPASWPGTLFSALSNIADLLNARVLMFIGSLTGAAANAAVLIAPWWGDGDWLAISVGRFPRARVSAGDEDRGGVVS
jgi:hypothetical protein